MFAEIASQTLTNRSSKPEDPPKVLNVARKAEGPSTRYIESDLGIVTFTGLSGSVRHPSLCRNTRHTIATTECRDYQ